MADETPLDKLDDLLEMPAIPSAEDKLFATADDWWNNACVNWLHDGWGLYAIGYKDAADILVSQVEQHNRQQDTLVYPVVFLYRQYLELTIKDLIRQGRRLQDIAEPFPKTHSINELWRICHALLVEIAPHSSQEELMHIARLIDEFSKVDPMSMAFRYPEDKDGNPSLRDINHINLRVVKEVIGKISVILGGADAMVGEYLSIKADMASEYDCGY